MPACAIRLCGRSQTSMIPNEVPSGTSILRRENDHVSNVGDDGQSALSSEVRRALIRISAIHEEVLELVAPEGTNAHAMSVATSAFSFSDTDSLAPNRLNRPCL